MWGRSCVRLYILHQPTVVCVRVFVDNTRPDHTHNVLLRMYYYIDGAYSQRTLHTHAHAANHTSAGTPTLVQRQTHTHLSHTYRHTYTHIHTPSASCHNRYRLGLYGYCIASPPLPSLSHAPFPIHFLIFPYIVMFLNVSLEATEL